MIQEEETEAVIYDPLKNEFARLWKLKEVTAMPVFIGTRRTGTHTMET